MKYHLDITDKTCPMTYVKTRLRLDKLEPGDVLEVLVNPGEPVKNIPQSAEEAGYKIVGVFPKGDKCMIIIEK